MSYTAQELITRAWYLSSIVSRSLDTPDADQIKEGLEFLNELLSNKTLDMGLIPYFRQYDFVATPGVGVYPITNLIDIESMVFYITSGGGTSVRYSMEYQNRIDFFGTPRAEGINSLPYIYHFERTLTGSTVYVYFLPVSAYPFTIWGKFGLTLVPTLQTDLSLTYELNYLGYLRYALAQYMCQEYNVSFSADCTRNLMEMENKIRGQSPLDLEIQKISSLTRRQGPDIYGQVNLGNGWTVP